MSDVDSVKRVKEFYDKLYRRREMKPEGVVREKLDKANKRIAELEADKLVLMERDEKYCKTISGLQTENLELQAENAELRVVLAQARKAADAAVNAPYEDVLDMGLRQALRELGEVL